MGCLSACGAQVATVPEPFHGLWDKTAALCNDADGVSRLSIDATGLGYYEAGATLVGSARTSGDRVKGTFAMSGVDYDYEGVKPEALRQSGDLLLTSDGAGLTVNLNGHRQTYVRCRTDRP